MDLGIVRQELSLPAQEDAVVLALFRLGGGGDDHAEAHGHVVGSRLPGEKVQRLGGVQRLSILSDVGGEAGEGQLREEQQIHLFLCRLTDYLAACRQVAGLVPVEHIHLCQAKSHARSHPFSASNFVLEEINPKGAWRSSPPGSPPGE